MSSIRSISCVMLSEGEKTGLAKTLVYTWSNSMIVSQSKPLKTGIPTPWSPFPKPSLASIASKCL